MRWWSGVVVLALGVAPAMASELPIRGGYGMSEGDCRSFRDGVEGSYVVFERDLIHAGGESTCRITGIRRLGPGRYALAGLCSVLEGLRRRSRMTLLVRDARRVVYAGMRLGACGP